MTSNVTELERNSDDLLMPYKNKTVYVGGDLMNPGTRILPLPNANGLL
jgi:hypothetical protein